MSNRGDIYAYIIEEGGHVLIKRHVCGVPRPGDEIRMGGEGKEQYYKVTRVVWVYDEPENPFERVNVGVELSP